MLWLPKAYLICTPLAASCLPNTTSHKICNDSQNIKRPIDLNKRKEIAIKLGTKEQKKNWSLALAMHETISCGCKFSMSCIFGKIMPLTKWPSKPHTIQYKCIWLHILHCVRNGNVSFQGARRKWNFRLHNTRGWCSHCFWTVLNRNANIIHDADVSHPVSGQLQDKRIITHRNAFMLMHAIKKNYI